MEDEERIRRAQLARKEARETIEEQSETLSDIDEKAIQIFRANVVLAGIIVSGISIAVKSDGPATALLNPFTKFGAVLLFTATILASVTYTSTSEEIGVSADDITKRILNERYDYDLVEEGLAEEYSTWIATNYRANAQNALLFTMTLITTVMAICYFFIGAIEIYRNTLPWYTNSGAMGLFGVVAKFSGLWGQLERWYQITNPQERFHSWVGARKDRLTGWPTALRDRFAGDNADGDSTDEGSPEVEDEAETDSDGQENDAPKVSD